jgi:uncharacterized protein (TIGR00255 family)
MAMKSMTGFGYSELKNDSYHMTTEIRSYNNRYLDIFVNLPSFLTVLEQPIREYAAERVCRGRVEITVKVRELQENIEVILDERTVRTFVQALGRLAEIAEVDKRVFLSQLLQMEGAVKMEKNRDTDAFWSVLKPELEAAFDGYEETRKREGSLTKDNIVVFLDVIASGVEKISGFAGEIEDRIRENLLSRFNEVMAGKVDEDRVLTETAVMLVKYGINEELERLRGHIDAFQREIEATGPCGKKLDFLCQELNREINTIGSKSFIFEVNQYVVQIKDAIEKMREQLRNIE